MYRQCQKLLEDPIQKGKEVLERIKQKETGSFILSHSILPMIKNYIYTYLNGFFYFLVQLLLILINRFGEQCKKIKRKKGTLRVPSKGH